MQKAQKNTDKSNHIFLNRSLKTNEKKGKPFATYMADRLDTPNVDIIPL